MDCFFSKDEVISYKFEVITATLCAYKFNNAR